MKPSVAKPSQRPQDNVGDGGSPEVVAVQSKATLAQAPIIHTLSPHRRLSNVDRRSAGSGAERR